jgi:NAD(P)-dependent dehydrogenase (short-subunit alcohol dehydrogenase family)
LKVAVVSGANRGIGLEVVRRLAEEGHTVVLGARAVAAGEEARAGLGALAERVRVMALDVADAASVAELARRVESELGGAHVLVNNAGVALDEHVPAAAADLDLVRRTLDVNLLGAYALTLALLPHMRRARWGRIVNVSSGMGQLADMGTGSPGYRLSKTGLSALTRMLASELRRDGILVNVACPGWVRTDLGGPGAPRTVEQGADTPVWLATLPDDGPTGGFFRDRKPIPW